MKFTPKNGTPIAIALARSFWTCLFDRSVVYQGRHFVTESLFQNIAEIDEIPCSYEIQKVLLPAAERAIYLELEHHLRALDMTIKRAKKTESDREKRLNNALGESK